MSPAPIQDPVTAPYFSALAEQRLTVQRCDSCQALRWPPLPGCPECRHRSTTWVEVEPRGTVWSFVTYHRAFQAELKDQIPYAVAMVQLEDGPYMVGRMTRTDASLAVGDPVEAEFVDIDGALSVRWHTA